jgi:hypothetical protein
MIPAEETALFEELSVPWLSELREELENEASGFEKTQLARGMPRKTSRIFLFFMWTHYKGQPVSGKERGTASRFKKTQKKQK